MAFKLYRFSNGKKEYWETWDDGKGNHTIHWGELGTEGETREVKDRLWAKAETGIQKEIHALCAAGFDSIDTDDHITLLIEYTVDGMGSGEDIEKRHRLQERMDQTLGWTGLGACDGGSIGSGTMEVCNYVVDFEIAKAVIEKDLAGTEFANYTRIFDEDAE